MNFEEWKRTGPALINALKARGEEETFRQLLSDLYPKKAHFIYELFQNAEDAGATECRFKLLSNCLIFEHNGRVFNEADVRSICGIGKSLKRNDPTKIGQFGVGFKAVFAYTNSPEIHSGPFKFQIKDLLVFDDQVTEEHPENNFDSLFKFPFNNLDKNATDAFIEIKNVLTNLGDNTLLFLKSINKINYQISEDHGSLERIESDEGKFEIVNCKGSQDRRSSHWMRYDSEVNISDELGLTKLCRISIAYSLESNSLKKDRFKYKIKPLDNGEVSIYFPAEKEVSNLKFHIHAPFASTIARDSIRECDSNESLRDEIANLIVSSLHSLRDKGFLDVDFLSTLPNDEDSLGVFYAPIRDRIIEAFQSDPLLPTLSGEFAPANSLFKGPLQIQKVISDDVLSLLTGFTKPLWSKNPSKESGRSEKFIESLSIDEWGWNKLIDSLRYPNDDVAIETWLSNLTIDDLLSFYLLLGEAVDVHGEFLYGIDLKIIKYANVDQNKFTSSNLVFLMPDGDNGKFPKDILFSYPEKYFPNIAEKKRKFLKSFFESIGVKAFDKKESIKKILTDYDDGEKNLSKHINDLRIFIAYLLTNPNEAYFFKKKNILISEDLNGVLANKSAQDIYIDAPYISTGLEELSNVHKKSKLWSGYLDFFKGDELQALIDFLYKIGIFHKFQIVQQSTELNPVSSYLREGYGRESANKIDQDFTIPNLKKYLRNPTYTSSKLIWATLITAGSQCALARYRRHAHAEEREADSYLICLLKESEWIPSADGSFLSPRQCAKETLGKDFPFDDRNGLLSKIDFGKHFIESSKEFESYKRVIESKGVSLDEFDDLLDFFKNSEKSLNELKAFLKKNDSKKLPISAVANPLRRGEILLEEKDTFFLDKVRRERSVFKGLDPIRASSKVYLRTLYKNSDDEVICQCCRREMPFRLKADNQHYFESVQILEKKMTKYPQCRLALCPNCAAMYTFGRDTADDDIVRDILSVEFDQKADYVELKICLINKAFKLYFVAKHFFDIQVILKSISS